MDKDFLEVAIEAALKAGAIQMESLSRPHEVTLKGVSNLVTEVDVACEDAIISLVRSRFPDHSFLAEEGGETAPGSDHLWIIDPLDGTTNYAHGLRRFCVSIGLAVKGRVEAGAVYNAVADELFTAVRGKGAWLNGERILVSRVKKVEDALICTGFSYDKGKRLGRDLVPYLKILPAAQSLRRTGCAALDLCDVAAGRFDGFWELNLNAWDVAAASLVIEEAGGRWTGIGGDLVDLYAREFLATNGLIHDEMVELIKSEPQFKLEPVS
ncbi:MAG TPA: inositol monophosphatase family protein [bacterium]|nr:inositol monophosphatase family protein [bacterium]